MALLGFFPGKEPLAIEEKVSGFYDIQLSYFMQYLIMIVNLPFVVYLRNWLNALVISNAR